MLVWVGFCLAFFFSLHYSGRLYLQISLSLSPTTSMLLLSSYIEIFFLHSSFLFFSSKGLFEIFPLFLWQVFYLFLLRLDTFCFECVCNCQVQFCRSHLPRQGHGQGTATLPPVDEIEARFPLSLIAAEKGGIPLPVWPLMALRRVHGW